VKVLVIVNESPWGSSLGLTAWRLVRAMAGSGARLAAIYFREDGVYHALPAAAGDAGTPDLCEAWQSLSRDRSIPLLLCSSAAQRRLDSRPAGVFREAGLAEALELLAGCDRVVSF
jgi:tRNA 2-thiouridine synthesizing protein D